MPTRSFDDDAQQATLTAQPVPRGIAFRLTAGDGVAPTLAAAQAAVSPTLPEWEVREFAGLPGWFEAIAPLQAGDTTAGRSLALAEFWPMLRAVRALPNVSTAEPLFLTASPQPKNAVAVEAFAAGFRQTPFELWGLPYDSWTVRTIENNRGSGDWHLRQLRVPDAWTLWRTEHPGREPGDGVLVGHPDTGFTEHPDILGRLLLPGKSFLRDAHGDDERDARDDLRILFDELLETPGHGTATASVIASDERDPLAPDGHKAFGVAPGARILPLRVSRSVLHFDFSNVARAIAYAVDEGADVISMSLGGPFGSEVVHESLRKARDAGVIIVAAAGNLLPTTAFPAAYPEVIAVAATNAAATPWRFSGLGRLVDVAAPGEDVWRARSALDGGTPDFSVSMGTGTSFATACVAGLAALWLSHRGGRAAIAAHYGENALVPVAFQYLMETTANESPDFVDAGRHGKGIPDARRLLEAPLPDEAVLRAFAQQIEAQQINPLTFFAGLFTGGRAITDSEGSRELTVPTAGVVVSAETTRIDKQQTAQEELLRAFFVRTDRELLEEVVPLIATDRLLLTALYRWRSGDSRLPLLDYLLEPPSAGSGAAPRDASLSPALSRRLQSLREREIRELRQVHRGGLAPGVSFTLPEPITPDKFPIPRPPTPAFRQLRAYSFDPSLGTVLETAPIHQVTIPTRWDETLRPGPTGEYLEIIDVDPASGCVYSPVDLNHPHVLAEDGLAPSEGNPQFHQQMVYAVAMNAIHRFELALGRPVFWSPLRPWLLDRPEEKRYTTPESIDGRAPGDSAPARSQGEESAAEFDPIQTRYVQRLRIYPHALREANAFYSPSKRALLFGYFPSEDETGRDYPGGTVFSCLSHDIIVHETTHALVDGMHPYFNEPTNEDVFAFHEAFADIMALFQHFTYPEVLRHQIANTRGDLEVDNLLGQLAQQFGRATGRRGALRNYLGEPDANGVWQRTKPDSRALESHHESHARGSVLVAAVFDAFLALYNHRVADLIRISTGGTGILPAGQIHPDLANRLAIEAAQTAEEVLHICIRAMDYLPPVDVTFGEFLRALITADYDLSPGVRRRQRIAFIESFRSWGIYPRDVTTLSEESLRWRGEAADSPLQKALSGIHEADDWRKRIVRDLVAALEGWQPGRDRSDVFLNIQRAQAGFHTLLEGLQREREQAVIRGLDLRKGARFSIGNLRPARRLGPLGEFRTEAVIEVVQTDRSQREDDDGLARRGGATLIIDLNDWKIRYVVYKSLYRLPPIVAGDPRGEGAVLANRVLRRLHTAEQPEFWQGEMGLNVRGQLAATYSSRAQRRRQIANEPFALLHRGL